MGQTFNLYLLRHGESEHGSKGIYQTPEIGLSEEGKKQAAFLGKRFKILQIDYLASSGMGRAKETAQIIGKEINITPKNIEFLSELKRPTEILGKSTGDPKVRSIKKEISDNWGNTSYRFSDEETLFEFIERVNDVIKWTTTLNKNNLVLVTHENFIRMFFLLCCFGSEFKPSMYIKMYKFARVHNGAIVELKYEDGEWKLISWNDVRHLTAK